MPILIDEGGNKRKLLTIKFNTICQNAWYQAYGIKITLYHHKNAVKNGALKAMNINNRLKKPNLLLLQQWIILVRLWTKFQNRLHILHAQYIKLEQWNLYNYFLQI